MLSRIQRPSLLGRVQGREERVTGLIVSDSLSALTKKKIQLIEPKDNLFSLHFLFLYLCVHSKNLSGALEAAMECQNRYNQLPRIHDITIGLVEKGDTELLQKGDTCLYDLVNTINLLLKLLLSNTKNH